MLQRPVGGLVPTRTSTPGHRLMPRPSLICNAAWRARIWDNLDTDVENLNASAHDEEARPRSASPPRGTSVREPPTQHDTMEAMDAWAAAQQRMGATGAASARAGWSRDPQINRMGATPSGPTNDTTAGPAAGHSRRGAPDVGPDPPTDIPDTSRPQISQGYDEWGQQYSLGDWGEGSWEGDGWGNGAAQQSWDGRDGTSAAPGPGPGMTQGAEGWNRRGDGNESAGPAGAGAGAREQRARGRGAWASAAPEGRDDSEGSPADDGYTAQTERDRGPYDEFGAQGSAGPSGRWASAANENMGTGPEAGEYDGGVGEEGSRWRQEGGWGFFASAGRWGAGGAAGQGRQEAGGAPEGTDPGTYGSANPSDITLLSRSEMEAVLPVIPNGRQAAFYQPRSLQERLVQLLGAIGASMVLSKSAALAAPALLYPIWYPWIRAGARNLEVYTKSLKCLGLWRATVMEVEMVGGSPFGAGPWAYGGRAGAASTARVRVLIGDPWPQGARVQLEFPFQPKAELLQPGESMEALVLGKDDGFVAFKVIREVYAPGLGLWLAEYPFVDRGAFLDVSLQVERARQVAMGGGMASGAGYGYAARPVTVDVDAVPAEYSTPYSSSMAADYNAPVDGPAGMYGADGYTNPNAAGADRGAEYGAGEYGASSGTGYGAGNTWGPYDGSTAAGVDGWAATQGGEGRMAGPGQSDSPAPGAPAPGNPEGPSSGEVGAGYGAAGDGGPAGQGWPMPGAAAGMRGGAAAGAAGATNWG